jgi:hypothetical protein
MKLLSVFTGLLFCFFFSAVSFATQVTVDTDNLSSQGAARLIELQKQAAEKQQPATTEKIEAWVGLGEKVGKAIAATCKELSVQVNEFIKTPVGKMAVAIILWKAVGKDLWHIVGGISCWMVITAILMWSFHFFHMKRKVKEKDGTVRYEESYDFSSDDAKAGSAVVHVIAFVIITGVCMLIVFL